MKLPAVPTANVAWSALVITGEALAGTTVRVKDCCRLPAALVAVIVSG